MINNRITNAEIVKTWKARIKAVNTTQEAIAKEIGASATNFNFIISGKTITNYRVVDKIEKILQRMEKEAEKKE